MPRLINAKSKVPALDVPIVGGGEFDIRNAAPDNFLILVVYRGYHCPKCKAQLQEIDTQVKDYAEKGIDVVAVSMDSQARAEKTVEAWGLKNLPVGYGLSLITAKAYGLFISDAISDKEPAHFAEPGLYVIRPDGALYAQYVQNSPFGRPPLEDIIAGLEFVLENDYPTRGTSVA